MNEARVYVVDDDAAVRDALTLLLETAGLQAVACDSAETFLHAYRSGPAGCIVLDIRMPGMSGLDLQQVLRERGIGLPIVFLTAHGDIPTTVRAMKAGAMDFLTKPVDGRRLVEHVRAAIARSEQDVAREARMATLTEREREVLMLAVQGRPNKDIARELGISHRTVELHRSRILAKTGASSLLELARLAGA